MRKINKTEKCSVSKTMRKLTWLVHNLHMTWIWLEHDLNMIWTWLAHDLHITCKSLHAYNLHMTCIWLAYDLHMTCKWLAYDLHMTCTWLAYDLQMTYTWLKCFNIIWLIWFYKKVEKQTTTRTNVIFWDDDYKLKHLVV